MHTYAFAKIRAGGDALLITLKRTILAELGWKLGDSVVLQVQGEVLVVRRIDIPKLMAEQAARVLQEK